jgi:thiol-disulfide isomerase/thioredoxin
MASAQSAARPWIGLSLSPSDHGVLVDRVMPRTPAERAGVRAGDRILAVDDAPVATAGELIEKVQAKGVGDRVTLRFVRAGKTRSASMALEPRPDELEILRTSLVDKPAPRFSVAPITGGHGTLDLGALAGKVVVVEFWATWCLPCNLSAPRLSGWQKKYGARGLRVVGVSSEPVAVVEKHLASRPPLAQTLAFDHDGAMSEAYRIPAVPAFVVIDRKGRVRYVDVGGGSRLDAVEAAFRRLLDEA